MRFLSFLTVLVFMVILDLSVSFANDWAIESERLVKEAESLCGYTVCQDPTQAIDILSVAIALNPENYRIYHYR